MEGQMAKNAKAGAGHNSGVLDDEDAAALQQMFSHKIRAALSRAALKKAEYDTERKAVNGLFSSARGEMGMTRKEFEEVLAAEDMDEDEFMAKEAARSRRFALQGLPVGQQLDMFAERPKTQDAADAQGRAYSSGKRAGLRGDDPTMPTSIDPMWLTDWGKGYADGQDELGQSYIRAQAVLDARAKAKPVLTPEEPEEDGGDEELTEAAISAGVKKVKGSDFMKPTAEETTFAEAAA